MQSQDIQVRGERHSYEVIHRIIGFHFKKEEIKNEVLAKGIKAKEVARELVLKKDIKK